ncbi:hypothetical protein JWR97_11310 [Pseudomonas cedrina subsp. fulgida]|nr:hypothetical protein [Pseudomonas cedrina subsp. fulgida]
MNKSEFIDYLEAEIAAAQKRISPKLSKSDKVDLGRLVFFVTMKSLVDKTASPVDLGTLGALNDVLQELGLLEDDKTLLATIAP